MHPLQTLLDIVVKQRLDFILIISGNKNDRNKMGFPSAIAERDPLLLTFPSIYHSHINPCGDSDGMSCTLSFDRLYNCKIPWSYIRHFTLINPEEESWPSNWEKNENSPVYKKDIADDTTSSPPDNVRVFRPRTKKNKTEDTLE